MNKELKKSLLKAVPCAFQCMHDVFGMDFQAPYNIGYIDGYFTVKKIFKMAKLQNDSQHLIVIISRRDTYNSFRFAQLRNNGVEIDFNYNSCYRISTFYTKREFDEARKENSASTYFLWQDRKYLKQPKQPKQVWFGYEKKPTDMETRYRIFDVDGCSIDMTMEVKNRIIISLKNGNEVFYYDANPFDYYKPNHPLTLSDFVDKSGYLVRDCRIELKRKAEALHRLREKATFDAGDFSQKVKDLEKAVFDRKATFLKQLNAANTISEIKNVFSAFNGFFYKDRFFSSNDRIIEQIEEFCNNVENKNFSSVKECNDAYNRIVEKIKS